MKNKMIKLLSAMIAVAVLLTPFAALAKTQTFIDDEIPEENIYYLGHEIYYYGDEDDDGDCYYGVSDDDEYYYQIYYFGDDYYLYFHAYFDNDNDYVWFNYDYPYLTVNASVYPESDPSQYAKVHAVIDVTEYDAEDIVFTIDENNSEMTSSLINYYANVNLIYALWGFEECLYAWDSDYTLGSLGFVELCEHYFTTEYIAATFSEKGIKFDICYDCGLVKATEYAAIGKITLSTSAYSYDGKAKKPSVKVLDKDGKTIAASNYTVSYQSGRKNIGRYWVKVKFNGKKYKGEKKLYFTIGPKGTSISSISARSKGFYVKWKKQAKSSTGYQIQYATDSKFTKDVKTVTISKTSTVSKTISKLKAKKTYYVRVRTYKTVSGNKCYSAWSGSKKVTTKK